uniref:Ig-like domain-containing protein n=1 Tax=Ditylenchus dipsaci TaxID=166011 RepID=A0A915DJS8_9BILA
MAASPRRLLNIPQKKDGHQLTVCVRSAPAQLLEKSMQNVTAMRGDTVEFKCTVQDVGKHMIAFFRDEVPPRLLAFDESVFRQPDKYELRARVNTDEWILRVRDVQESDIGGYICQLNSNPVLTKIGYLNLKIPPTVSRSLTPSAVEVREGHNVTLSCQAEGNPLPTVLWRRQDRQIIRYNGANGYGESVYKGSELRLHRVSRKHMSEYVCVASNGIPPDESWTIKLHVLFEPIVIPQSIVTEAPLGAMARIVCNVEAWPRPLVTWFFNDRELSDWNRYATEHGVSDRYKSVHVLEIKDVQPDQYGRYRCVAANDYGRHYADIRLIEAPAYQNANSVPALMEGSGSSSEDDEDQHEQPSASSQLNPHHHRRSKQQGNPGKQLKHGSTALADYYYDQLRQSEEAGKLSTGDGDLGAEPSTSSGCSLLRPGRNSRLWKCVFDISPGAAVFVTLQLMPPLVLLYYL